MHELDAMTYDVQKPYQTNQQTKQKKKKTD